MNIAWDSFRILDNNSNNVIFMRPEDPCIIEYAHNNGSTVSYPDASINLETIRKKLIYRYYIDLDEYIAEMRALFENQIDYMGKTHKLFLQVDNIRKRFFKFIEKS